MNTSAPVWLFDLDNTLHNAGVHIFPHINRAMTAYLAEHLNLSLEEAGVLRSRYWRQYGATLRGMVRKHGTCARHFLHHTHQFDDLANMIVFNRSLLHCLRKLPGKKYIFSNAPRQYLDQVLHITGLEKVIHGSFSVEDLGYQPKPQMRAYQAVLRRLKLPAHRCIMVEDTVENLLPAKQLGMRTMWISPALKKPIWVDQRLESVQQLFTQTRLFNTARHKSR
jgi:putative hydrolase of the HAD superfamily